jgi:hypothetical protein
MGPLQKLRSVDGAQSHGQLVAFGCAAYGLSLDRLSLLACQTGENIPHQGFPQACGKLIPIKRSAMLMVTKRETVA